MTLTVYVVFVYYLITSYEVTARISLEDFYPYGRRHGDTYAPINDDGSTPPITASSRFPFFNHQHETLIVNTNGVISFLGTMSTFTPSPFPLASHRRLIAPYWADIDTNNGGTVWYRETTNQTLLDRASRDIHELFPEQYRFQAAWMFIATWSDVAFFGASYTAQRNRRCTFQCVLVTNGRHSFATFLYNKIEWTTGTASGGTSMGLGGTPAQVGFDAGDGMNYFAVTASRIPSIINVTEMSNIDIPGKFVFRVDSTTIKDGGCNVEGSLTITPKDATMLGGTRLIVSGPCFEQAKNSSLHFDDGTTVICKPFTNNSVSCISPQLYRTGKEYVLLKISRQNGETTSFNGVLHIVNHGLTKREILRAPQIWTDSSIVKIFWYPKNLSKALGNSSLRIDLYQVKNVNENIRLHYHSKITTASRIDTGSHTFPLKFSGKVGVIKVSSNEDGGPHVWSNIFTVNVNRSHSEQICEEWNSDDVKLATMSISDVSPCPCTLKMADNDLPKFSIDPSCRFGDFRGKCNSQPFSSICYKQNTATNQGYDNQCCYDKTGNLMNQTDQNIPLSASGYAHRYHYKGDNSRNVPYLSNFYHDIAPYHHCCIFQSGVSNRRCSTFYNRRPRSSCLNYVPPRVGRTNGDPHFVTFDGQRYTFNPVGEFKAISMGNFTLQLRMEQIGQLLASSITSFVAKPHHDSEPVEIRGNSIHGIEVLVNGTTRDLDESISSVITVDGATIEKTSNNPTTIVLNVPEEGISIKATSGKVANRVILNLFLFTFAENRNGNMTGLFGDNDGNSTNDLKTADGSEIHGNSNMSSIHYDFGLSWRVPESESFFTYEGGRTFVSYQNTSFQPYLNPPTITDDLIEICGNNSDCMYDFHVTGDRAFAEMSANSSAAFDEMIMVIEDSLNNNTNNSSPPELPVTPSTLPTTTTASVPTTSSTVPTTTASLPTTTLSVPTTASVPTTPSTLPTTATASVPTTQSTLPTTTTASVPTTTPSVPTTASVPTAPSTLHTTTTASESTTTASLPTTTPSVPTTPLTLPTTTTASKPTTTTTSLPTTTSSVPTTASKPTTTSTLPSTTTPTVPTTTASEPTTTAMLPTATPSVPTTTASVPTTTTSEPTTTAMLPTATPSVPTTTASVPSTPSTLPTTTTASVPTTTTSEPTTTAMLPTATPSVPTTTASVPSTPSTLPTTTTASEPTTTASSPTTSLASPTTASTIPTTSSATPKTTALSTISSALPSSAGSGSHTTYTPTTQQRTTFRNFAQISRIVALTNEEQSHPSTITRILTSLSPLTSKQSRETQQTVTTDSGSPNTSLPTTVTITVAGSVLVIGVIIIIIIVSVTMKKISRRHRRESHYNKDKDDVSQSSGSLDSFNFHIKRPLFRRGWINVHDTIKGMYDRRGPYCSNGGKKF